MTTGRWPPGQRRPVGVDAWGWPRRRMSLRPCCSPPPSVGVVTRLLRSGLGDDRILAEADVELLKGQVHAQVGLLAARGLLQLWLYDRPALWAGTGVPSMALLHLAQRCRRRKAKWNRFPVQTAVGSAQKQLILASPMAFRGSGGARRFE